MAPNFDDYFRSSSALISCLLFASFFFRSGRGGREVYLNPPRQHTIKLYLVNWCQTLILALRSKFHGFPYLHVPKNNQPLTEIASVSKFGKTFYLFFANCEFFFFFSHLGSVCWWAFSRVWVTASILTFSGLFSVSSHYQQCCCLDGPSSFDFQPPLVFFCKPLRTVPSAPITIGINSPVFFFFSSLARF